MTEDQGGAAQLLWVAETKKKTKREGVKALAILEGEGGQRSQPLPASCVGRNGSRRGTAGRVKLPPSERAVVVWLITKMPSLKVGKNFPGNPADVFILSGESGQDMFLSTLAYIRVPSAVSRIKPLYYM